MSSTEESLRILVLRGGAVGDFVFTVPVLDALRARWPGAHITLACYPRMAALATSFGLADATLSLDSADIARLFVHEAKAVLPGRFDTILSYLHDPDGVVRGNLLRTGAKRVVCGRPLPASEHAADWLIRPLSELGIRPVLPAIPRLGSPSLLLRRAEGTLAEIMAGTPGAPRRRAVIAIHPGSGSPKKNWSADRFATLAVRLLGEPDFTPLFIFGYADSVARESLAALAPAIPVLPSYGLAELAAVLGCCAGYAGNDSGITHLAAAVGIPVVALFGPTDPAVWGPRGPNVRIINAGGDITAIAPDEVFNQVLLCRSRGFRRDRR